MIHSELSPGTMFSVVVIFKTLFYKFSDCHRLQVPTAEVLSPSPNPGHTTDPQIHIQEHKTFFNQLSSIETIEIIGHSFENRIDDEYFAYIKEKVKPNCKWKISCYSKSDKKNNDSFSQRMGLSNYESFSINSTF